MRFWFERRFLFVLCILSVIVVFPFFPVNAQNSVSENQDETVEASVIKILEEKQITPEGGDALQLYQKLELIITSGRLTGNTVIVENGMYPLANIPRYALKDRVVLTRAAESSGGGDIYYITDYIRRDVLILLFILFIAAAVVIGRWRGFMSLLGMALSFLVIFKFVLPQISAGSDPVIIAIIGSLFMVPVTFYFSHGLNKKTSVSIAGTLISLVVTGILATVFVNMAKLTGFSSEEANFLQTFYPGVINIKGLLLAGILIGGLGVFDDITISQASIVAELKYASGRIHWTELYRRAMNVGHDHIASMVNTLVLVYTGAAMPLLLLFINNPRPFSQIINYEFIAEEIIRTLVASIGLIMAVPITTFIAAVLFSREDSTITSNHKV